jgi:hypothetical protein
MHLFSVHTVAQKLAARFVYPKLADRLLDPPTQEKDKWQNSKPLKCKQCWALPD